MTRFCRSWLLLLLLFLLGLPACRDKVQTPALPEEATTPVLVPVPEQAQEAEPDKPVTQQRPLLWEMTEGENGSKTYILGTIHIGFEAADQLPKEVWERFDAAKVFVMETDLTAAQADTLERAVQPQGGSLKAQLGKEAWGKLDQMMGGMAAQFDKVKPWFVVSMLLLKMIPPEQMTAPMDQVLHDRAKRQGKKLAYLETPQQQLDMLEKALSVEELREMVLEFEKQKGDLSRMMEAYEAGDEKTLERLSFTDLREKPEMYDMLFFDRNRAWIPQLVKFSKAPQDTFVAFGAGHLFGSEGVLSLLEAQGYVLKRVETN